MDEELRAKIKKGAIIGSFFGLAVLFYALGWRSALVAYVIIVGVFATLAILIQSGRGGGLASSLGGLGGDSILGVRSATPIAKATYVMLALFIFNTALIARMGVVEPGGPGMLDIGAEEAPAQQPAPSPLAPEQEAGEVPAQPLEPVEPVQEAPAADESPAPQEGGEE